MTHPRMVFGRPRERYPMGPMMGIGFDAEERLGMMIDMRGMPAGMGTVGMNSGASRRTTALSSDITRTSARLAKPKKALRVSSGRPTRSSSS